MVFRDRHDAGQQLAALLTRFKDDRPLVLGLPRGGVPVAAEVASALEAELEVWVVRKLGCPIQPELGLGALAEGGETVIDEDRVALTRTSPQALREVVEREAAEVERRVRRYRGARPRPEVRGRTVLLVDDGVATGGTARAALRALRKRGPARLVLAVPVASTQSLGELAGEADEIVCVEPAPHLHAIGAWYDDFRPTYDEEVVELLERAREPDVPAAEGALREGDPARFVGEGTLFRRGP